MEHNLSKYNILRRHNASRCQKFKNLKVDSLFASDNSEPKLIFRFFFSIFFVVIFWCNLKVSSLFVSDDSDPKIIFRFFFSIFLDIFGVI